MAAQCSFLVIRFFGAYTCEMLVVFTQLAKRWAVYFALRIFVGNSSFRVKSFDSAPAALCEE